MADPTTQNAAPKKTVNFGRQKRKAARLEKQAAKGKKKTGGIPSVGGIPDSTIGPKEYSSNIKWFLDEDRLDPANDPTLQPVVDAFKRESEEDFWNKTRNLRDQLASKNILGTGYWGYQMGRAREEEDEATQATLASLYKGARDQATTQRLGALDQVNARDIAAGQNETAKATARISSRPAMADVGLRRAMWNAQRPWDDMNSLLGVLQKTGDLSGYYDNPNFIPNAAPYTGPNAWQSGLLGGGAGLLDAYSKYQKGELG